MDIIGFFGQNTAVLSGIFIGLATITGVSLNIVYSKIIERRTKQERNSSTASALAAELLCNSYHLRDLYLQIYKRPKDKCRMKEYTHIDMQVYKELLVQIGDLGSAITFMVVDTYGDIKKMRSHMDAYDQMNLNDEEVHQAFLDDIQMALVKALSCSMVLYLYADYMTGRKWLVSIRESRIIRIERTISDYCKFMEKTDESMGFIDSDEQENLEFRRRFKNKEDRDSIKELFATVRSVLRVISKQPEWRVQLTLRALSYTVQNTLVGFSTIEIDEYDLLSEQEYKKFLPNSPACPQGGK